MQLAALIMLAVASPVASAGGPPPPPDRVFREDGLKYVMTEVTAGPTSDVAGVEVPCGGRRWRAVGGGADVVQGFAPAVYLVSSHPFDLNPSEGGDPDQRPDDGWVVFVREEAGPDLKLNAWAVCAKRGRVRYRTETVGLGMNEGRTVEASCRGDHVLGGGFFVAPVLVSEMSVTTPFDGPDRRSRRDDGWTVHGFNDTGTNAMLGAYAMCSGQGDLRYRSKAAPAPSMLTTASPKVRCKRGTHATAGGGSVGSGHLVESHPVDGGDRGGTPDDGWRVNMVAAAGFKTRAFAVCRP